MVVPSSHHLAILIVMRFLDVERAHRYATQLVFCEHLRLVVLHEWKKPIPAAPLFGGGLFREFLASALRHRCRQDRASHAPWCSRLTSESSDHDSCHSSSARPEP